MKTYLSVVRFTLVVLCCIILASNACAASKSKKDGSTEWPYRIETDKGKVLIYQPQVESYDGDRLEAMAAISVSTEEVKEPVYGAMWFDCRVVTDKEVRTVTLTEVNVTNAKFPDMKQENVEKLRDFVREELNKSQLVASLDRILAGMEAMEKEDAAAEKFNNAPPEIIYASTASVLISIDGDPVFKDIENSPYQYVVNTPFFLVRDEKKSLCYLKGADWWYSAKDPLGPWTSVSNPPQEIVKLAEQAMKTDDTGSKAATETEKAKNQVIPRVLVRTHPAELIQSNGDASFAPLQGTSLLYVTNSDEFILMDIKTQDYYVLISGRWFSAKSLQDGSWNFVQPEDLPADFANIPADSEMGGLRTSVPGTAESQDALLENVVPQTATVDRKTATLKMDYDGRPKFDEIPGTSMQYAVNCDKSVLLIDKRYYCVDNAIWFMSDSPTGPWEVCVVVPEGVQDIPPESPVYNVKYVYVYDYTPEVVYVGYTPGYCYSYVYHGCIVYGTGWYYRPWWGIYYYPHPVTYGFNACWNPYAGWCFSYGVCFGNPYAWFGWGWHSPYYGWWGPAGYRHGYYHGYHQGYAQGYYRGYARGYWEGSHAGSWNQGYYNQPRTSPYASNNVYRNRTDGVRQTGGYQYDPRTGKQHSATRPSAAVNQTSRQKRNANNVYTSPNGEVYRQKGDTWQQRDEGKWNKTPGRVSTETKPTQRTKDQTQPAPQRQPSQTTPSQQRTGQTDYNQLNRTYQERTTGTQRTQQYQNYKRNVSGSGGSSVPAGGARTGGLRR
ncbi:MAG TPA: hypothetical protein PKH94_06310 [Bacteroidales bacterium]|nr:hypothetical protein [Bacteroidales bacterium]HNS46832.1 hypothetical protein [Bacteroidales bacterium]